MTDNIPYTEMIRLLNEPGHPLAYNPFEAGFVLRELAKQSAEELTMRNLQFMSVANLEYDVETCRLTATLDVLKIPNKD